MSAYIVPANSINKHFLSVPVIVSLSKGGYMYMYMYACTMYIYIHVHIQLVYMYEELKYVSITMFPCCVATLP